MMKRCIFCENRANSKEHVVSIRLARHMGITDEQITVAALTESKGYEARHLLPLIIFEARCVCRVCNSGWMNELEAFVKDSTGPLIEPRWPHLNPTTSLAF